ncbi:IclR family transcriptional regulator [Planctomonas sp. JC2975]|uniref:IclR family transcriptional regulator n=1 Tax=Planctomonas sp. JC2975 TaxID=2729626 RepID=UPI00147487A0|nr:IclR family transcriptional regulator [Planctomonas sp. JC2975]NNC11544.1 IclR family transcriptional regulator [Planctomonas sp. JC2975]
MPGKAPAADATLRILRLMSQQRGPVAASTIARTLELPRSTVYQLLSALTEHGFVIPLPELAKYGLGVAAFELSSGFNRQQPLTRVGAPVLARLVDETGLSGHLTVLLGRDVVYLVEERAPHGPYLVTDVGVRLPAHLTASGLAMLAGLPAAQVRALYPDKGAFTTRTGSGVTSYRELSAELGAIRERGYAVEDSSITQGLRSLAVAVPDHVGWPAASVAVTFPADRDVDLDATAARIARAAAELGRRIGG